MHPQDSNADTSERTTPGLQVNTQIETSDEDALGLFLSSLPETLNLESCEWITDEDWETVQNQMQASTNNYAHPQTPSNYLGEVNFS